MAAEDVEGAFGAVGQEEVPGMRQGEEAHLQVRTGQCCYWGAAAKVSPFVKTDTIQVPDVKQQKLYKSCNSNNCVQTQND